MATSLGDNLSDEIINIKCCLCDQDNRVREADKYCVQCKDYYCAPCIEIHRKIPGTKEHKLLDRSDFRSLGPDGSLPSFPTQRCTLHPAKVVDMFCEDHNEAACASFMFLNHRNCTNVHTIPEKIDILYNSTELTKAKQNIHKTKANMEEIKREKERKVKELKEAYDREVDSVRSFRQKLQTLLDSMEQQTIQELTKEYKRIEASLTDEIKDINKLIDAMNEASSQLRKSEGNRSEEFICVKSSEKVTAQAGDVEAKQQLKPTETLSFNANQDIKTFLQQNQVLGKVSCKSHDSLFKVKNRREIDVNSYKDDFWGDRCIRGLCMTADGTLLLTDNNNKKLKHLDINTGTIIDYAEFKAEPRDVCLINKNEAALTMENETVQFVSLGNKITATHTFTMKHACLYLAHKDSKLYITDAGENVYIHNINGQELKRISTDASGNEIIGCSRHIIFSAGGDKVYVADSIKGVVILDIQGNYLSTLTDPSPIRPQALCTDGRNLFVCGLGSNDIVQIGQDNTPLGELVKIQQPLSLCFDPHKNRLIVSQFKNNKITVLDLEK